MLRLIGFALLIAFSFKNIAMAQDTMVLTKDDLEKALSIYQDSASPEALDNFSNETKAFQNLLLADAVYYDTDDDHLSHKLYLKAIEKLDDLNLENQGYALDMVGYLYQESGHIDAAISYYKQAIDKENINACSDLGYLYETQEEYRKAEKTYLSCLPELESATLYTNLGTLYYNGMVGPEDYYLGGAYWMRSFKLDPYGENINFNMGIFNYYELKNYPEARYHLAACKFADSDCAELLQEKEVKKLSSSKKFLDELLSADSEERSYIYENRLLHYLGSEYPMYEETLGVTPNFVFGKNDVISGIIFEGRAQNLTHIIFMANFATYVDLSPELLEELEALAKKAEDGEESLKMSHLGQYHHLYKIDDSWVYEIRLD